MSDDDPDLYELKLQRCALALLRLKREAKDHNLELTKQINTCQRAIEEELGEYAVVLASPREYDVEPGWEPIDGDIGGE